MATLKLKVVTPESLIFEDDVEEVYLFTPNGEIGILPHHVNLMSQITAGELRIKKSGKVTHMATGGGMLQMVDNTLSVLTDLAEEASEINEKEATDAKKRAEDALTQTQTDEEYAITLANLEKALAQLKVKRRIRSH